jgi:hypothetical protein
VLPVVEVDGHLIGDGRPGPVARALLADLLALELSVDSYV